MLRNYLYAKTLTASVRCYDNTDVNQTCCFGKVTWYLYYMCEAACLTELRQ